MGNIPYEALKFPANLPLGWPATQLSAPHGSVQVGVVGVTMQSLLTHAAAVGDLSVITGTSSRTRTEFLWRTSTIESALVERNGFFSLSPSFIGLDSSEKVFISYLLGMTQASLMAERILGAAALVNVDAILSLPWVGKLYKAKRPDMLGYVAPRHGSATSARLLVEAKGTSVRKNDKTIGNARTQVKSPSSANSNPNMQQLVRLLGRNALRLVSYSYFQKGVPGGAGPIWRSHLEDPPLDDFENVEWDDDEYLGLILVAKLFPLYETFRELPRYYEATKRGSSDEMLMASLADDTLMGFPASVVRVFDRSNSIPSTPAAFKTFCTEIAETILATNTTHPAESELPLGWETGRLNSGFALSKRKEVGT